ncbi:uncharacterized protein LOC111932585 isoform X2 [Cyanistes caeruleus]|uniref:uncharacterized protein LOC111932585 isoform X2 n=1 Tax=Cyanistes caeruleus TaxID=156563 RepID=UPI000CDAF02B|nr:uncharacterized protein LOC111932585 isoform X2 [Cyanistes caeruleus]
MERAEQQSPEPGEARLLCFLLLPRTDIVLNQLVNHLLKDQEEDPKEAKTRVPLKQLRRKQKPLVKSDLEAGPENGKQVSESLQANQIQLLSKKEVVNSIVRNHKKRYLQEKLKSS